MDSVEIENCIYSYLYMPLNNGLDGIYPDIDYAIKTMAYYYRDEGYAQNVADAMMPLYREFLFSPTERMIPNCRISDYPNNENTSLRYHATLDIRDVLENEVHLAKLFDGMPLTEAVERCLSAEEQGYNQRLLFLRMLSVAIKDGFSADWDDLYSKVKPELINAPKNYRKTKLEYCCMLMSVVMIMRDKTLTMDKKHELLNLLAKGYVWPNIAYMYSIIVGVVIGSGFSNLIQVVRLYGNSRKEYAHLLFTCVKYRPSVVKAPEGEIMRQAKYDNAYRKLQEACDSDQATDLDELFAVIFPNVTLKEYSNDSLKLTTAETQKKLKSQQEMIQSLTSKINSQNTELKELRLYRDTAERFTQQYETDAITIDEIKEALNNIKDPEKAQQLYFYLNHAMRKNKKWKKHEDEFADLIDDKINAKFNEAENNAARIVKAVAERPQMNDNNGLVAGGNIEASIGLTDEQVDRLADKINVKRLG